MLFLWSLLPVMVYAQTNPVTSSFDEQQLENNTAGNDDNENEDDTYQQQMQYFLKHPINVNTADEYDLQQLKVLHAFQIKNFLSYRKLLGKFINLYELQAVPGWSILLIKKIQPFVFVGDETELFTAVHNRLKGGEHSVLLRVSQTLERSKGYLRDTSYAAWNGYEGSPQKIWTRYMYRYKNLLQYGIAGEKDAGEQFFKGRQKQGFDFCSAHFFIRNAGLIRSLALGDFTVNLGQGLIQWQSLAFKKGPLVTAIKREESVLRPYNAAGEINFHRGAGITLAKRNWAATVFISLRKLDANFIADTSSVHDDYVSSLQTSGYHRTKSELDDKGVQKQMAAGGNLSFKSNAFHLGLNGIVYKYSLPLYKTDLPYNLYALTGRTWGNYSLDYSYTFSNVHVFGEAATTVRKDKAFMTGAIISAAPEVDISVVYRNISKGYQALYANAFTEATYPGNENGLYIGVALHQGSTWQLNAYADIYRFPWLKFNVDAPSSGKDHFIQLVYAPSKRASLYSSLRSEVKDINIYPAQFTNATVGLQQKQTWRTHFACTLNQELAFSCRFEALWFNAKTAAAEQGVLTYINFLYKSRSLPLGLGLRLQKFETNSYNSRLYAYENDVLYSFAIPVFYDKGFRYYINANYEINKKLSGWIKCSQTIYSNKTLIGSGFDAIKGNKKTDIRVQLMYKF